MKQRGNRFKDSAAASRASLSRKVKAGGRPPEWLKAQCAKAVEQADLIGFLRDVASGKPVKAFIADKMPGGSAKTVSLKVSADIKDRIHAAEILLDRGWGKPAQAVTLSGDPESPVKFEIVPANANAGNKGH